MKYKIVLSLVVFMRLFSIALLFVLNPILAMAINMLADAIDGPIYDYVLKFGELKNQRYDKAFDFIYYIVLIALVIKLALPFTPLLIALFLYRSLGQIIFFIKKNKRIFFYFQNFFECFVLGILIVEKVNPSDYQVKTFFTIAILTLLTVFKIWNENFLHRENKTFTQIFWIPTFKLLGFKFAYRMKRIY